MAAGPVGSVWTEGAWPETAWAAGAWAGARDAPHAFGDLTTLFVGYVETLLEEAGGGDAETLVALDQPDVRAAVPAELRDDLNTVYARYLS